MFKIAISTKLMPSFSLPEIVDYAAEIGFDGVELWMHQVEQSGLAARELKKLSAAAGITCQVHMDTRDINIASTNRIIREASLRQIVSAIDYAADLEASVVTVHPGRFTSEKELITSEQVWNYQIEAFAQLARIAESKAVVIGIENMENRPKEFVLTEADVSKIMQKVGSNSLKATIDVAHLNSVGNVDKAIEAWCLPIVNVHISQSNTQMHLPIFTDEPGGIDYQTVFPMLARKYQGMLVLEGYVRGREKETIRKSHEWLTSRELCSR